MRTEERNIASLVRNGGRFYKSSSDKKKRNNHFDGIGYLNTDVMDLISELFDKSKIKLITRNGEWVKYIKEDNLHQQKNINFCYVYTRQDKPRTLFSGNIETHNELESIVDKTANLLAKNVLEQRKYCAFPPKNLIGEEGETYCLRKGTLGVIPLFGFSIELIVEKILYDTKGISFLLPIVSNVVYDMGEDIIGLVLGAGIGYSLALTLIPKCFGKKIGKGADKIRVEKLPEKSKSFLYGSESIIALQQDYIIRQLRKYGMDITPYHFSELDKLVRSRDCDIDEYNHSMLMDIIYRNNEVLDQKGIPLEEEVERVISLYKPFFSKENDSS